MHALNRVRTTLGGNRALKSSLLDAFLKMGRTSKSALLESLVACYDGCGLLNEKIVICSSFQR